MKGFEAEGPHRRSQEDREMSMYESELRAKQRDRERGMWFAFIISLSFLAGAVYLIDRGHDVAGTALAGTTLVSLVTTFILGRRATPEPAGKKPAPRKPSGRRSKSPPRLEESASTPSSSSD